MRKFLYGALGISLMVCAACAHSNRGNDGQLQSYAVPVIEAGWIRNGEPIILDGNKWYPTRDVENLIDMEVYQIGEYRKVQIFVDKLDVKPYQRIYTKFSKNKFRYFERLKND